MRFQLIILLSHKEALKDHHTVQYMCKPIPFFKT